MLNKKNILNKKNFQKVYQKGKFFKNIFFNLRVSFNKSRNSHFGIVVSKKISNKATQRNKYKRWVAEIIKKNLLHIKTPINTIVSVKPLINKSDFTQTKQELEGLFRESGLL